jgi:hypothetical protein
LSQKRPFFSLNFLAKIFLKNHNIGTRSHLIRPGTATGGSGSRVAHHSPLIFFRLPEWPDLIEFYKLIAVS